MMGDTTEVVAAELRDTVACPLLGEDIIETVVNPVDRTCVAADSKETETTETEIL